MHCFRLGGRGREPLRPMTEIVLMFGRNIGGELRVNEALWSEFVAREIMLRFPADLMIGVLGQWRDPGHKTLVQEPSKELRSIALDGTAVDGEIAAIVEALVALSTAVDRRDEPAACASF